MQDDNIDWVIKQSGIDDELLSRARGRTVLFAKGSFYNFSNFGPYGSSLTYHILLQVHIGETLKSTNVLIMKFQKAYMLYGAFVYNCSTALWCGCFHDPPLCSSTDTTLQ